MAQKVGSRSNARFYVRNSSKNFILPLSSFDIEKETSRLVDRLKIETGRNDDIQIGDELEVFDQASNDEKVFGGYISQKEETDGLWSIEADEYVVEVVDKKVKKVYRNESPEAILQDLIDNQTSLNFNAPVSSGFTIDKYVLEGKIEQAVKDMTDILDWQARTTPQKEFYLEPRGRIDSGVTLEHGKNAVVESKKSKDSKFVNTVELRAGRTNYTRSNSFSGDGSTTEFTLSEVPVGSVEVSVDGTRQEGAISEDLQDGDDFYIDKDGPSLIFATAPASGVTIDISYTYEVPILVEAETDNAVIPASNREISTTIKRKWIKTFRDAREYAKNYVENHSRLVGGINLYTSFGQAPTVGYVARVVDDNKNIDRDFTVEKVTIDQDGEATIRLGDQDFNSIEWRNGVQRRIKELEKRQTTNKVLSKFRDFAGDANVNLSIAATVKKREVNDSFIIGSERNSDVAESYGSGGDQIVIDDFTLGEDY